MIHITIDMNNNSTMDNQQLQKSYIDSLSEKEKQAYEIARNHLGSSFSLEKSLGFLKFCEKINKHTWPQYFAAVGPFVFYIHYMIPPASNQIQSMISVLGLLWVWIVG